MQPLSNITLVMRYSLATRREPSVRAGSYRWRAARRLLAALIALAGALQAPSAFAMPRFVDSSNGIDIGICNDAASPCQRIAFAIANSMPGDTINLVSLTGVPNVYAESGLIIPFNLRIRGVSAALSVIDAGSIDRVITVDGGNLLLDRVTLRNGDADATAGARGGAVRVINGDLTIRSSVLRENVAQQGGAIAAENTAGTVRITSSKLLLNRATGSGGAIHCDACDGILITRSVVFENTAGAQGGAVFVQSTALATSASLLIRNTADDGGAIFANSSQVSIDDSELRDNEADQGDGGGVFSAGNLSIQRSTLAGNSASDNGGGVFLFGDVSLATSNSTYSANEAIAGGALSVVGNFPNPNPTVHVSNSTFVDNVSIFSGQGHHVSGAWTFFRLDNSILHLSPGLLATNPVCTGPVTTGAANLIDDASCNFGGAAFNFGAASGLTTTLAANGGLGRTHAIAATSNAVDTGFPGRCTNSQTGNALTVDQRRSIRPVDGDLDGVDVCDIGAFEVQ